MTALPLSFACQSYDRTIALKTGAVSPRGIDLTFLDLPVEEIFYRMLKYHEFDVAEMSLSSYVASLGRSSPPFIAIPAFVSRAFRHSEIFVNRRAGITSPRDLAGKRVGTPEYEMTAAVWIRGILAEHHELPVDAPRYLTGGLEQAGRSAKSELSLPPGIDVQRIPDTATLSEMLATGEIDALYTARSPSCFTAGYPDVGRMFDDPMSEELRYFAATRIFPIMHVVVVGREVYEKHRWVARELMTALDTAKAHAQHPSDISVALPVMLPWLAEHVTETRRVMGDDYWPYGLEPNHHVLSTFLRYASAQGIASAELTPEQLFAPETLSTAKV